MTELSNCGVTELELSEAAAIDGGSDLSYAIGYTIGIMAAHPYNAIDNALQYYLF
ncbi:MAG TPA: hypothetical protein VFH27_12970 [Longimicrobiaceae bacterium]|nr:hypothetical protein [Longimicrobiaceae bacterium]